MLQPYRCLDLIIAMPTSLIQNLMYNQKPWYQTLEATSWKYEYMYFCYFRYSSNVSYVTITGLGALRSLLSDPRSNVIYSGSQD